VGKEELIDGALTKRTHFNLCLTTSARISTYVSQLCVHQNK